MDFILTCLQAFTQRSEEGDKAGSKGTKAKGGDKATERSSKLGQQTSARRGRLARHGRLEARGKFAEAKFLEETSDGTDDLVEHRTDDAINLGLLARLHLVEAEFLHDGLQAGVDLLGLFGIKAFDFGDFGFVDGILLADLQPGTEAGYNGSERTCEACEAKSGNELHDARCELREKALVDAIDVGQAGGLRSLGASCLLVNGDRGGEGGGRQAEGGGEGGELHCEELRGENIIKTITIR